MFVTNTKRCEMTRHPSITEIASINIWGTVNRDGVRCYQHLQQQLQKTRIIMPQFLCFQSTLQKYSVF